MSKTTMSGPLRVGGKPHLAGTVMQCLAVPSSTAEVIAGTLPKGVIIMSAVADDDGVEISISDVISGGSTTLAVATVTAGVVVDTVPTAFAEPPNIEITTAVDPSTVYINYKMYDVDSGANG